MCQQTDNFRSDRLDRIGVDRTDHCLFSERKRNRPDISRQFGEWEKQRTKSGQGSRANDSSQRHHGWDEGMNTVDDAFSAAPCAQRGSSANIILLFFVMFPMSVILKQN